MSISNLSMKPHSFSQTSVVSQMSSSQTASRSTRLLPKRGQSQNFVKARSTNIKPRANYQNLRANLNNGVGVQRYVGVQNSSYNVGLNGLTGFNPSMNMGNNTAPAASLGAQLGQMTFGVLNKLGVIDKLESKIFGTQTNSQAIDSGLQSLGGGNNPASLAMNADTALTLSNMSACSDSASLSAAIDGAKGQLTLMEGVTSEFESAASESKNKLSQLNEQKGVAQQGVTDANSSLGQTKGAVTAATQSREQAMAGLKTGDAAYDKALDDYTKAHDSHVDAQNNLKHADATKQRADAKLAQATQARESLETDVSNAQSAYDNCPDTIQQNGINVPNPQKAKLKAELELVKVKLEQAKTAETQAKDAATKADDAFKQAQQKENEAAIEENRAQGLKDEAKSRLGDLKEKADKAEAELTKQNERLDKAKSNVETAQENLDVANEKLQDIQAQIDSQNGIIQMAKAYKSDTKALADGIKDQEKRLKQMKKNEAREAKNAPKFDTSPAPDASSPASSQTPASISGQNPVNPSDNSSNINTPPGVHRPDGSDSVSNTSSIDLSQSSTSPQELAEMSNDELLAHFYEVEGKATTGNAQMGDRADYQLTIREMQERNLYDHRTLHE